MTEPVQGVAGARPVPGDSLRAVHWRATARRGRLVVREWEAAGGQGLEVVLDRRCAPAELEEALEALSALVHVARARKGSLRVRTPASETASRSRGSTATSVAPRSAQACSNSWR